MQLFVAYTETSVPTTISTISIEDLKEKIEAIEKQYARYGKAHPTYKMIGRAYKLTRVQLVSDKFNPYNIIRTIPVSIIEEYSTKNS